MKSREKTLFLREESREKKPKSREKILSLLRVHPEYSAKKLSDEIGVTEKAIELGIEGPYTSWWHMFGWNTFGVLFLGPAIATKCFFDTLNKVERKLNETDLPNKTNDGN